MTDTPLSSRQEDDALAAEYVLGVGDLAERSTVEARIRADPAFAALVAAWERRLAALNDQFDEAPAPDLLPRLEARLFPAPTPVRVRSSGNSGLLRWLSGMVAAAALFLLAVATLAPPRPGLVATLGTADNRLVYEIRSFGETLRVTRTAGVPAVMGQVHELWVIAPGAAPVSLGLLGIDPLEVDYPEPPQGWIFAISIEPEGGSPTGLPTGPVILTTRIGDNI
jgi:anti-sigma-K factor RskA